MNAILLQENIDILNVVILGIISLVLLMLSAMASGSEVAFFSLKRADIADLESRSDASSRRVIDLLDNPDRLLATILVTNNMINICLVIVTTQIIDALFIFTVFGPRNYATQLGKTLFLALDNIDYTSRSSIARSPQR